MAASILHSRASSYVEGSLSVFPTALDSTDNLYYVANNAETLTTSAVSFVSDIIPVVSTSFFPSKGLIKLDDEIIYYSAKKSKSFTGLTRGFVGTSRARHKNSTKVLGSIMGEHHNSVKDAILKVESTLGVQESRDDATIAGELANLKAKWETPQAAFVTNRTNGAPPLTVFFRDISTGSPIRWLWEFGDGNISPEQNPAHVYEQEGMYEVTLSITTAGNGISKVVKTSYIEVSSDLFAVFGHVAIYAVHSTLLGEFNNATNPLATLANWVKNGTVEQLSTLSGSAPLTVVFTDQTPGSITSRIWTFGDGDQEDISDSFTIYAIHTYTSLGAYKPILQVENDSTIVRSKLLPEIEVTL